VILYFNRLKYIDIDPVTMFIIAFITVVITYNDTKQYEHMESSRPDLEALYTLASVYNTDNVVFKNLKVTGTLTVDGRTRIGNDLNVENVMTARHGTITEWFNQLPRGVIVAWTENAPPAGWMLCDGRNGTPDLRGRFIVGKGQGAGLTNYNLNDIGGLEQVTLTVSQMPTHTHGIGGGIKSDMTGSGYRDNVYRTRSGYNSDSTGGNQPHENRPPYHALTYIIKI
jgi:microcystin-dependent protein